MATKFEIEAKLREDVGKGASRRLRFADKVPAVIYGADVPAQSLVLDHNKLALALSHEAFYSHILTLKIGKKTEQVILKDLQRHPAKPRIAHIDFQRVRADQKLKRNIPLHFLGEEKAPGAKAGGIFTHAMTDVEVSCLPANLPQYIEVDVSNLELNEAVHLSQLKIPKGVELTAFAHGVEDHDQAVISIQMPRIIEEVVAEAPATEETAAEGQEAAPAKSENKE